MLPASEFVIYFCWKLYKFQKCRGKIEKRVEEVRIFLTFGPKWEDLLHSKNNLFLIFFKTFFLWCRRYESALYGWVITTWRSIFFGSKIYISSVIFYGLFYGWNIVLFHCQGRYWLLYAWMSLLISFRTKGLKWFFFPCSVFIFGNRPANNVIQGFFHTISEDLLFDANFIFS